MRKLFKNAKVITMENKKEYSCVIVKDDLIEFVGDIKEVEDEVFDEVIDLENNVLLPAFIDPHSHMASYAKLFSVQDLNTCKTFNDIIIALKEYKKQNNFNDEDVIIGFGYDNNFLEEKAHPDNGILDTIKNPVIITHKSGHMGVLNQKALAYFDITKDTQSPQGGLIKKDENNKPTGYLEETAFMAIAAKLPKPDENMLTNLFKKAQEFYASFGIATAQEGAVKKEDFDLLKFYYTKKAYVIDVVAYIDITENKFIVDEEYKNFKSYKENFRIGGYKLFLDGSPQGRTAWMRKPYENDENYFAYPIFKDEEVEKFFKFAIDEKIQILVHCNGDAACEQMINCYEKALNGKTSDIRPVMVHAQFLQKDQLEKVKKLNIIPSFFIAHTKYWADIHIENFGFERASNISLANSAKENDILFTLHQDSPVINPDMLETIKAAVTRTSINGTKLNQDECISVYDALKAVTINAAFQYFEEDTKGTIAKGKKADFVVLDKNPLEVKKEDIDKIKVLKTFKNAQLIYQR